MEPSFNQCGNLWKCRTAHHYVAKGNRRFNDKSILADEYTTYR